MLSVDIISIVFIVIFLMPLLYGLFRPVTKPRLQYFIGSLFDSLEFLGALFLSIYFTGKILAAGGQEAQGSLYKGIWNLLPSDVKNLLYGQGILAYVVAVPVILLLLLIIFRVITTPVYRLIIEPVTGWVYDFVDSLGWLGRSVLGALWRLPRAVCMVLILGIGFNLYSYYFYTPELTKMLNQSPVYQALYDNAIYPAMNSNIAKRIPVIVNDSFAKNTASDQNNNASMAEKLIGQLAGKNVKIIEYFNGVTLDEAIKSNSEIDQTAVRVAGNEKNSTKKAYLIYKWVSQNIKYDYEKAERLSTSPSGISSGSINAFNTRKGVCFDYSALYVSMCRAVGLKVRLVTGLGYSGTAWGDHAWNQVYSVEENRWIHVDTTFGSAANYFDKPDFQIDHKYDDIQGEW